VADTIFGLHAIEEFLKRGKARGTLLLSRGGERIARLRAQAEEAGVRISEASDADLSTACGSDGHKGAVLVLDMASTALHGDFRRLVDGLRSETALCLVLDRITDPQNLGAILRSADQFRVDLVVIPSRRSAQETQTVSRVSSGASAYVPLAVVANIPSSLELLKEKGFWIFGADLEGEPAPQKDMKGRACIVMGSEGSGMRRLVREKCDFLVRIPAAGHVDSFNVSVAAGILLYEARRQQGFPSR
jgi:23S rRNA (guanosine2251-2'-O)-methyltransferase